MLENLSNAIKNAQKAVQTSDIVTAREIIEPFRQDDHPGILRMQAIIATAEARYADALSLWQRYDRQHGISGSDHVKFGAVLKQVGQISEAISAYRAFQPIPGVIHGGRLPEAVLHVQLGHHIKAIEILNDAVRDSEGTAIEPRARIPRARQFLRVGRLAEALSDYIWLETLMPDNPAGLAGRTDVYLAERDAASAHAALSLAHMRFPDQQSFLRQEAQLLNQQGDDNALIAFVERLQRRKLPKSNVKQLLGTLFGDRSHYFTADMQNRLSEAAGDAYRPQIEEHIFRLAPNADPAEAVNRAREKLATASASSDSIAAIMSRRSLVKLLIRAGQLDEADATVDTLRRTVENWPYSPPILGDIFEWQLARHGRLDEAKRSYWRNRRMFAGLDRSHELQCLKPLTLPIPPVTIFCQVRNELLVLPAFFRHYRALGVRRFVMVDNGSTDGTTDWLLTQPDTEVYFTTASFRRADAGNRWINPLIARPEYADTLCLRVDADEHLVYPHFESRPITQLWDYMREEGADVLAGFMLDMMPRRMAELQGAAETFTEIARYFDPPPTPFPIDKAPYLGYYGGPRSRLFSYRPQFLTKSSGLRGGGLVEQQRASHCTSPAKASSVSMVLLHYKFRPDFFERAERIAGEHEYAVGSQEFTCYCELGETAEDSILSADSRLYEGSQTLLKVGALRSSPAWDAYRDNLVPPPIHLFWPTIPILRDNWGDRLNPHLAELLSGRPVRHTSRLDAPPGDSPIYRMIGSHLLGANARSVVWGTGFISAADRISAAPRKICAVRGPLSRQMLLDQGIDCPSCYGDPALLYPLFYRPEIAKKYELGVIRHVRDRDTTEIPAIHGSDSVLEIEITGGLQEVVEQILSCRRIASSSLHGIIAAHAYGVPAVWLSLGDNVKGDGLKFRDYYASVGLWDVKPIAFDPTSEYLFLYDSCALPAHMVDLEALLMACPFIDDARKRELIARLQSIGTRGVGPHLVRRAPSRHQ